MIRRALLLLALVALAALADQAPCAMCTAEGAGNEPKPVKATGKFDGKTYNFCQASCQERFMANPGAFVKPRGDFGPAPAFSLVDAEGRTRTLADYRGKVLVLHLWATWCPACVAEMPRFVELQAANPKLAILGLSKDKDEQKHRDFLVQKKVNFPSSMQAKAYIEELKKVVGPISAIPTTLVVDPKGRIVYRKVGLVDADFEPALKAAGLK